MNLFSMKAGEAYVLSQTSALADKIWNFKNPGEQIDRDDREYISWINSLPVLLKCVRDAGLDDLYVVFEMKTPISNKAIDVILLGSAKRNPDQMRILVVELKQWSSIKTARVYDTNKVFVTDVWEARRHPMRQLNLYVNNLKDHHSGILRSKENGRPIAISKIAYLHNFENKESLYTGKYAVWNSCKDLFFGKGETEAKRLSDSLRNTFANSSNKELLDILSDYEPLLGDEGLAGLVKAYKNEATLSMMKDQQAITDFIKNRLIRQKQNPHKEIVTISGGPGTGKTIAGIRFILEYVNIFNNGKNDNKVIFCLPKSKTVKAMFDTACSTDEENEKEYCCYLDEIARDQNLVVVDEAHRITKLEETLNKAFEKGTKLLILLQDDHQLVRPGEQGTVSAFREYAAKYNIEYSPADEAQQQLLTLVDEKRCDPILYNGLTKLLYDENVSLDKPVDCVHVFDKLSDMETWLKRSAQTSRSKYVFPFAWPWTSRKDGSVKDVAIPEEGFFKQWNPEDTDEQVMWLNDNSDDRVACIFTSQGLDMDNVALVWWDDLTWDPAKNEWVIDHKKLEDPQFKFLRENKNSGQWISKDRNDNVVAVVTKDELDMLIKNTYYVMLSRPRKTLGIWFKDKATQEHVLNVWGIKAE